MPNLLRVSADHVINLKAYQGMRLLGPNASGLYIVQLLRFGDGFALERVSERNVERRAASGRPWA